VALTPAGWVAAIICLQFILLVGILSFVEKAPPFDVVEELAWAPHWLLGTEKHPTLPSFLIEAMRVIVPDPVAGPLILSEVAVGLTYFFVFRLGCLLLDPLRAAAGTLLLVGSYYFTAPTIEFNHNVLQMPIWAGLVLQVALLRRNPSSWLLWIGIGVTAGLGLWVKYSAIMLYIVLFGIGVAEAPIRRRLLSPQPYVAIILAALVWAPHVHWLIANDFLPIRYAKSRLAEEASSWGPVLFLLSQLLSNSPIAVLLGVSAFGRTSSNTKASSVGLSDRAFLWIVTLAPLALVLLFLAWSGSAGKPMWGMPMFPALGLLLATELPIDWTMARLNRLGGMAVFLLILVPVCLVISIPMPFTGPILRTAWPMHELATKANAFWQRSVPMPLRFVGGDPWIAGLIVVATPGRPAIINGDDISESPWVDPAKVRAAGVLYVTPDPNEISPYCQDPSPAEIIPLSEPRIPTIYARVCHGDAH
jgi:hypothetical protein